MKKYLVMMLALAACTPEETKTADVLQDDAPQTRETPIPEYIVGEWEMVDIVLYNDGDSSRMAPKEAGMSAVAINEADGSFKDIFNGEVAQGKFYLKNDTAVFNYDNNSKRLLTYHFANDTLSYKGRMNGQLMKTMFVKKN